MGSSFMRTESLLWRVYARVYPTVTRSYPYRDMMDAVAGKIPAGSKLVDLGCGTGGLLHHIAAPVSYLGIDRQAEMLDRARETATRSRTRPDAAWRSAEIDFRNASIFDPIDWGDPDCVVINNTFYTLPDKLEALQAIHAQLAPGGRLILCDPRGQPRMRPVLRAHFADYRARHGAIALTRHSVGVLWRLLLIALINLRILDRYDFVDETRMRALIAGAGFDAESVEVVYAGQNQLVVATKPRPDES